VTQKLLDVTKRIAKDELKNESWLRAVAKLQKRSYEEMRRGDFGVSGYGYVQHFTGSLPHVSRSND